MTDVDQRIREDLDRLVGAAPLPPTVDQIAARRAGSPSRRPVVLAVAAAVVVLAAVVGAIVLRQTGGEEERPVQPPPTTAVPAPDAVVFLDPHVTDPQVQAIRSRLAEAPEVVAVDFVDQQEAYDEFRRLFRDDPALVESVRPEILPPSFRLTLVDHDVSAAAPLLTELEGSPGVREVQRGPVSTSSEACADTDDTIPAPCLTVQLVD